MKTHSLIATLVFALTTFAACADVLDDSDADAGAEDVQSDRQRTVPDAGDDDAGDTASDDAGTGGDVAEDGTEDASADAAQEVVEDVAEEVSEDAGTDGGDVADATDAGGDDTADGVDTTDTGTDADTSGCTVLPTGSPLTLDRELTAGSSLEWMVPNWNNCTIPNNDPDDRGLYLVDVFCNTGATRSFDFQGIGGRDDDTFTLGGVAIYAYDSDGYPSDIHDCIDQSDNHNDEGGVLSNITVDAGERITIVTSSFSEVLDGTYQIVITPR